MPYTLTFVVCDLADRGAVLLEWKASDTIDDVKEEASASFGRQVCRLTFAGRQLEDGRTLDYYNIQPGDTVDCTFAAQPPTEPPTEPPGKGTKGKGKGKKGILRRPSRPTSSNA